MRRERAEGRRASPGSEADRGPPPSPDEGAPRRSLLAWALYDWANAGYSTVVHTFVFAAYFTRRVAESETRGTELWGYSVAAAGLVVALGGPVLGAVADQGRRRKPWLGAFTALCVAAVAGLFAVGPHAEDVPLALVLVALAAMGSDFASLFYNAMLPALAPPERVGRWSGFGWGLGYVGGVCALGAALVLFLADGAWVALEDGRGLGVRASCLLAAAWYGAFALPLFLLTPDERGPARPPRDRIRAGLRQLGDTLRRASRYAGVLRFLVARMLYVDGLGTLFAFGGVYAAGTFDMGEAEVLRFGIGLSVAAGLGAWLFAGLDDRLGGKRTVALSLAGLLAAGSAAIAAQGRAGFWAAALGLGLFVGPVQAASRSYLARVAPPALRNELFGLYALSGKATAFAGPFLVASVTAVAGSQRAGMAVILVFFAAGLALLAAVPDDRPGGGDAGRG